MPPFPELIAEELRRHSGGQVILKNFAVGGKSVRHGLEVVGAIKNEEPDLVIIAYGINEVGLTTPDQYLNQTIRIIEEIKATAPDTEIILVASMLGNPEWHSTPAKPFFAFRDALKTLRGPGIALADLTQVWADLLGYKSYHDLTGNGVNHPNDFGHRIYAQVILDLLLNTTTKAEQDSSVDTDKPHQ
jgi:lysophospholipase L1-like esterase